MKEKRIEPSELREFTDTSDMLILQSIVEDRTTIRQIAELLGRDPRKVAQRIDFLKMTGGFKKIHKKLMRSNGPYAVRYRQWRMEKAGDMNGRKKVHCG